MAALTALYCSPLIALCVSNWSLAIAVTEYLHFSVGLGIVRSHARSRRLRPYFVRWDDLATRKKWARNTVLEQAGHFEIIEAAERC
jgi:hypothetical protein